MDRNDALLFVYGTLRRGTGHRMHHVLAAQAEFLGHAQFQGQMYLVARYPGVIASPDPDDRIVGDVFRLAAPDALLARLDRYEACKPDKPDAPYVREMRPVCLDSGRTVSAWIYLYNRSIADFPRILSGNFLDR